MPRKTKPSTYRLTFYADPAGGRGMDVATLAFERAAALAVVEGTSVKNEDDGLVLVEILLNVSSVTQARKAADAAVGAVSARWDTDAVDLRPA